MLNVHATRMTNIEKVFVFGCEDPDPIRIKDGHFVRLWRTHSIEVPSFLAGLQKLGAMKWTRVHFDGRDLYVPGWAYMTSRGGTLLKPYDILVNLLEGMRENGIDCDFVENA